MIHFEMPYWQKNKLVCGIDEAGRGPLAGPVVVAGVILRPNTYHPDINDSKKLSEKKKRLLFNWIIEHSLWFGVEIVSEKIIDRDNIYRATQDAMQRLADRSHADCILSDAMPLFCGVDFQAIIKGDQKSVSIASASILAKVIRDDLMAYYDDLYPGYQFRQHKGYPTKAHYLAIKELGICPIHRHSFTLFKD